MDFFNVKDCPVCFDYFVVLMSKKNKQLLFYCPSCGTTWDKIPEEVDDIKTLKDISPEGVMAPSREDLRSHGIFEFEVTNVYESLEDLLN